MRDVLHWSSPRICCYSSSRSSIVSDTGFESLLEINLGNLHAKVVFDFEASKVAPVIAIMFQPYQYTIWVKLSRTKSSKAAN